MPDRHDRRPLIAFGLWVALAFVVWNLAFDSVIVRAGREYVYHASLAARNGGHYELVGDWMAPAASRARRIAGAAGGSVLIVGLSLIALAVDRDRRRRRGRGNG